MSSLRDGQTRLSLLLMTASGITTRPLPEIGEVAFGRSEQCEIYLPDAKLSRKHAVLRVGARLEIVDLGSLNGTLVGDRRIASHTPIEVAIGDVITMGSTMIVVQTAPSTTTRPRYLWTPAYFERRLEEECRARPVGPLTILRVRFAEDLDETAMEQSVGEWVRARDVAASFTPRECLVLLPDTSIERAEELAVRVREHVEGPVVIAAAQPRDGVTASSLMARIDAPKEASWHLGKAPDAVEKTALERLAPIIERVAASTINVLILGETGVGKEILARRLHVLSPRETHPMLCLNCAALSESLLESELFGHERGAFTGANQAKLGLLETAQGGTIFLDEIGEMPVSLQAKLLRVLEQREVMRVGGLKARPIDVRFIAATNRDLEEEVAKGRFRQDLFFRLNGISLSLPPLRDRLDEILPLSREFIEHSCKQMGRSPAPTLSPAVSDLLLRYEWPGNIRELRNLMDRAVVLSSGPTIELDHLPADRMRRDVRPKPANDRPTHPTNPVMVRASTPPSRPSHPSRPDENDEERDRILAVLEQCAGNQTKAAKILGMARGTLIARIEAYGVRRPRK